MGDAEEDGMQYNRPISTLNINKEGYREMNIYIRRCIISLAATICIGSGSQLALAAGSAGTLVNSDESRPKITTQSADSAPGTRANRIQRPDSVEMIPAVGSDVAVKKTPLPSLEKSARAVASDVAVKKTQPRNLEGFSN